MPSLREGGERAQRVAPASRGQEGRRSSRRAQGNGQAIGAIAIAFGATLYAEIREALGDALQRDAADILQDFLVSLAEAKLHFPRVRGSALPWMIRIVRSIAVEHRRQRSADTGRPV